MLNNYSGIYEKIMFHSEEYKTIVVNVKSGDGTGEMEMGSASIADKDQHTNHFFNLF